MSAAQCILRVAGKDYGGWTALSIERSIEQIAGCFDLDVTVRWPGVTVAQWVREGVPCEVLLGDDLVVTGHVDEVMPDLTDTSSRVQVQGRDRTGDLVDCSAIYKTGAWRGVKLEQIVRDIAAPFGIPVAVASGVATGEVFKRFSLEDGERAFDAIDRACRLRAVLCTSTPQGTLLLTLASDEHSGVTLAEGVNIKRIRAVHSWKDRFSRVTVKAQTPGDDDENGAAVAHAKAQADDPEINRYRPLVVMSEHHTSTKSLADRAAWEVKVRMGRGKRGTCTVAGWRTGKNGSEGPLWQPNTLVHIVSDRMLLDADMLIVGCRYMVSESDGTVTELTFALPDAFDVVEGAGRRQLGKKLSRRVDADKRVKGVGYQTPWNITAPEVQ